jgi:flagellar basal body-associated protein FliL
MVGVGGLAVLVLGLIVALAFLRPDERAAVPAAAPPIAPPVADASGQPQPGPTPASPPVAQAQAQSKFGLNAQKLLDEMRTHNPNILDADALKLVQVGDANLARNQANLTADDPQIRDQVRAAFPNATNEQLATMTRCTAEYVEREWARLHNTTPPDSTDDHGG